MKNHSIGSTWRALVAMFFALLMLVLASFNAFAAPVVIPAGTVLSMTGSSCPAGFTALAGGAGRVLMGAGTLGSDTYTVGGTGGSARHTLTEAEIPSHVHGSGGYFLANLGAGLFYLDYGSTLVQTGIEYTLSAGGGQPHENRPPYLVVTHCVLGANLEGVDVTSELFVWAIVILAFAGGVIAGQQR